MRRYLRGFTIIELMITLAVVAVLAALGLPAFDGAFERSRASTEANDLAQALNYGRLEAINRSQSVTVEPTDSNAGWAAGITIKQSSDDAVLRTVPAMSSGAAVAEENGADAIVFNSFGGLNSPSAAVAFTYTLSDQNKVVAVCLSGRIQVGVCN
ncbi:GspH/FimT family pseudopilin [Pseudomonas sp. R-28-1W-6]|jgi:type IV fimbrial biogenesis protein FimU|uniref:GspH/FimT family pseudopilin n=1 Tax=Pseudomonas sp. R-28-1W-6 TaxID=2650101 RepID=UPI001365E47C|nr:GspH/FimT family pseudopilin [Pseudomonas sp. R-28-1W-6]